MRLHAGPLAALAPLAVHPDPWVSAACLPQQPRSLVWYLQRAMRPPRAEFFFPWRRSQMKMNYTTALACATLLLPTIATATPHKSYVAPGDVDDAAATAAASQPRGACPAAAACQSMARPTKVHELHY